MKVLSIHAHPDDNELGCGGTLAEHVALGDEVHLAVATTGSRTAASDIRANEQRAACSMLGVKALHMLAINGGDFRQDGKTTRLFIDLVSRVKPDIIYTHNPADTHQEHREVGQTAISAARHWSVQTILLTESVTSIDFAPNWYVPVSEEDFVKKILSLKQHASQVDRWRRNDMSLVDVSRAMARFRGSQIGEDYAEGFTLYRFVAI